MSWESRGNNEYYYRKHRIGNRVISEYIGNGFAADYLSIKDEIEREQRVLERLAWEVEKAEVREIDKELDEVEGMIRMITRAVLLDAGYHPHKGTWRKRRDE